jgi:trimeric autotransporter adhesin
MTWQASRKALGRFGTVLAVLVAMGVMASSAFAVGVVKKTPASAYQANGTVRVTIVVGDTTYLGGQFTAMVPNGGGTAVTRNHVAAVSTATGALLPWDPNVNGNVYALAAGSGGIYIGGTFTTVGGAARKNLVEVAAAPTTGPVVATFLNTLKPNKAVRGLAVAPAGSLSAGNLFVGGAFTTPRRFALEANATSGALVPAFAPVITNTMGTSPEVRAVAVNPAGSRVILGGFFNTLNTGAPGDPNPTNLGVGAVDATTGASVEWDWHTSDLQTFRPFQLLAFAQDGSTLFGAGTGNGGSAMSWNMETGALNYIEGFNGNVVGVGVADGMLYMGGHFSGYDGPIPGSNFLTPVASRDKLAAVDELTGLTLSPWNPAVNTPLGIEALGAGGTSVAIGGEFTKAGGVAQQHFTLFHE